MNATSSEGLGSTFRRRTLAAFLVIVGAAALLAQPAVAKHHPLPDLAMTGTSDDVATPEYGIKGETASFSFVYHVKNVGKGPSPATEARVFLLPPSGGRILVASGGIPKLKPGRRFSGLGDDQLRPLGLALGEYKAEVCIFARFREYHRHTSNNCKDVPRPYYVIKRSWTGTADGQGSIQQNPLTLDQSWQAAAVTFTFGGAFTRPGQFTYTLSPASLNYQISGGGDGCTVAGGGTISSGGGELKLDYAKAHYDINGNVPDASHIPYVITCPNTGSTPTFTFAVSRFVSNLSVSPSLPFGQTVLQGSRQEQSSGVTYEFHWNVQ